MNAALADAILALLPATAAVLRDAGGGSEVDEERDDMRNLLNDSDAGIAAAYRLKTHGDDNPTWAQAMKGDEANQWRDGARAEMQNIERHG
eukprot:761017-Pleurochrysis_carterae.AAC.1